jgi:hypothetical protein
MPKRHQDQLKMLVAREAARILAEEGRKDYLVAKTKAAERLGVDSKTALPTNIEVEQALQAHQMLFQAQTHQPMLKELRMAAVEAMRLFSGFNPRLVGPVLSGVASEHSEVALHLFADSAKDVVLFLIEQKIPYDSGEKRYRFGGEYEFIPTLEFVAGDVPFQLSVFPKDGIRQSPLSPVDGKPMRRANLAEVEGLLLGD